VPGKPLQCQWSEHFYDEECKIGLTFPMSKSYAYFMNSVK
jgi:hypothetical protein